MDLHLRGISVFLISFCIEHLSSKPNCYYYDRKWNLFSSWPGLQLLHNLQSWKGRLQLRRKNLQKVCFVCKEFCPSLLLESVIMIPGNTCFLHCGFPLTSYRTVAVVHTNCVLLLLLLLWGIHIYWLKKSQTCYCICNDTRLNYFRSNTSGVQT